MHNIIKIEQEFDGRILKLETGLLANQAHGAVTVTLGETIILATATMGSVRSDVDFFPLLVDFEEKYYASGKIKGSRFVKREARPSDNAILTARLIDRPLRPLFPKGLLNDVQIVCTVLSADLEIDPDILAITGASAALLISGIPFNGPAASVKVGYIPQENGDYALVLNPTYEQLEHSKLDFVVAGTLNAITMVEAAAQKVSEDIALSVLEFAHTHIKKLCEMQLKLREQIKIPTREYSIKEDKKEFIEKIKQELTKEKLEALTGISKFEVKEKTHALEKEIIAKYQQEIKEGIYNEKDIANAILDTIEHYMRSNILKHEKRIDGRKLDEIRPIACMTGLMPRTHGSALFQRGETQALSIVTLGGPGDAQIIDTMDIDTTKRYIHYYNFPPYAVGEVKPLRGPSRRDIGHGDLAERALRPVIPSKEQFGYTILVVSEICSCNGSSSMASVCGSSLALMDAGVPITEPVAGIAMGLITDGQGNHKILTDIQGVEDFAGDMDFKVAGTKDGITALQMDIKVSGLTIGIMKEALYQAKKARLHILEKMLETLAKPRGQLSRYAPLLLTFTIDTSQIRAVIGKGGETIQKIIAETGVAIDIEDNGLVTITAQDQESGKKAFDIIQKITYIPKIGDEFDGKVTRIMDFGAFVEFIPEKEGLVHISELSDHRINRVEDGAKVGDKLKVKLIKIDEQGRYNLSHRATKIQARSPQHKGPTLHV